jgi:type II secretory pathway component PulM
VIKDMPWLFRNKMFLTIAGLSAVLVVVLFAVGALMWEPPVQHYEQVMEPLFRLKR